MTTRILLIDDHPAMRHGLRQLLEELEEFSICAEAENRHEALIAAREYRPDFILLDIALQGQKSSGLNLIPELLAILGPLPILVLSMHDEKFYAEQALAAGARGYLMKQEPVREIITAIRRILAGEIYLSREMSQFLLCRLTGSRKPGDRDPGSCLSKREFEIFRLLGKGYQPRKIAENLNLSSKTVESHRRNLRRKLGFSEAADLAHFAVEWFRNHY